MLDHGRRGRLRRLAGRGYARDGRGTPDPVRRAGGHRKADAAAGRRSAARARRRDDPADRGGAADARPRNPGGTAAGGRRPHEGLGRRRCRHSSARLRRPRLLLRRGHLRDRGRRQDDLVLFAVRGRRHPLRTPHGAPVRLQQPARRLPALRRLRQGHRHRRGPGDPRQRENHLRRGHRLLARRNDEPLEGSADRKRLQVRFPDPHAVPRADLRAEAAPVAGQRIFPRARRVLRIHRRRTAQNPVPGDEGPLHGQDHAVRSAEAAACARRRSMSAWAARRSPSWWSCPWTS